MIRAQLQLSFNECNIRTLTRYCSTFDSLFYSFLSRFSNSQMLQSIKNCFRAADNLKIVGDNFVTFDRKRTSGKLETVDRGK